MTLQEVKIYLIRDGMHAAHSYGPDIHAPDTDHYYDALNGLIDRNAFDPDEYDNKLIDAMINGAAAFVAVAVNLGMAIGDDGILYDPDGRLD